MPAPKGNKKEAKKGRPTAYSQAVADKIIDLISTSSKGLDSLCKAHSSLPHPATVRRWISQNEGFRDRYARAKEEQADLMADEIIDIADELTGKDLTHEKIGAAKQRIDARKWVAAKLKPKKYGDKLDHTTDGESLNKGFYDFLKETSQE